MSKPNVLVAARFEDQHGYFFHPAKVIIYFEHNVVISNADRLHKFAIIRFYFGQDNERSPHGDSIRVSAECSEEFIVPVHLIFARFIPKFVVNCCTCNQEMDARTKRPFKNI